MSITDEGTETPREHGSGLRKRLAELVAAHRDELDLLRAQRARAEAENARLREQLARLGYVEPEGPTTTSHPSWEP